MNNKGQIGVAMIMIVFISILVGLILLPAVADEVGKSTNTVAVVNASYTVPADTVVIDLTGQELIDTPVVWNGTAGEGNIIPATNYTIDEGVSTTSGLKTVRYTANNALYEGATMYITYTYGPDGYIESSGGRSLAGLIVIFFALGVAAIALVPTLRGGLIDLVKNR